MTQSAFSPKYDQFRALLAESRKRAGLTQVELAEKLARPQSYVSKYERGERRLDVVEFLEVAKAIGFNATEFLMELEANGEP